MAKAKKVEAKAAEPVLDFDVDFTNPVSVAPIAAVAWNAVKGPSDASFAEATIDFQHTLLHHAKSALTSPRLLEGKTNLALFEQEVNRLHLAAKQAAAKAA